jgi:hypothetical protein
MTRQSNTVRLFLNGVQCGSATVSQEFRINTIAGLDPTTDRTNGILQGLRIVAGTALYTSNFTPPTGTLTDVSGTQLLAFQTSTVNQNSSSSGITMSTASGTPVVFNGGRNGMPGVGNDYSGNNNYWDTNNINFTTLGVTYDSMTDVPTLTSATTANYAVVSPIDIGSGSSTNSGNLNYSSSSSSGNIQQSQLRATFSVNTGKWYWEVTRASITSGDSLVGVVQETQSMSSSAFSSATLRAYVSNGNKDNGTSSAYGATWTNSDVIGVALDMDAGTITFYKNNTSQGTAFTGLTGGYMPYIINNSSNTTSTGNFNFGQRPFTYTPPTGFVALNTFNLPTPTIGATASTQANDYFNVITYTGNGSTSRAITGVGFAPDFVWMKSRSQTEWHYLFDTIRGVNKVIFSNTTDAETTDTNALLSFDSDGYTIGNDAGINNNTSTYVTWNWNAGGSTVTNTSGSISSQVRANTTAGFSIVTFTANLDGTTSNTATIGHGLGVSPSMIILKTRSATSDWWVYHSSLGTTRGISLNQTAGVQTTGYFPSVTSSTFIMGSSVYSGGNQNYVAYCFSQVAGYSRFGSYTGNGSTDGTFIYTGFRPRYVMMKRTDTNGSWYMIDTSRAPTNVTNAYLIANGSNPEATDLSWDILSNGFKLRSTYLEINASSGTYVYMAFAESPFKFANAR